MNVNTTVISETRKQVIVSFSGEETAAKELAVFKQIHRIASIPGFRPGKAPEASVRKRYAKEIQEEFTQKLHAEAYRDGLEKTNEKIVTIVNFEGGSPKAGEPIEVVFTVDVQPEVALPEYKGIAVRLPIVTVEDGEVDEVIERMRREQAQFVPVEQPAKENDYVQLTYEGTIDGASIKELAPDYPMFGTQVNTWEQAGQVVELAANGMAVPAIPPALVGLQKGDSTEVEQEFPADFPVEALAGKKATYKITVNEVRETQLPEIDEEFLKNAKAESLEQLRTRTADDLKAQKEQERRGLQRRIVSDTLVQGANFQVPESQLEAETERVMREIMESNMRRGVPMEEFEKNKEQFYEQSKGLANNRAKLDILLAKIADEEKLTLTNQELSNAVYYEAMRTRVQPDKLAKDLSKDRDQLRRFQRNVILSKALQLVCDATVVTDVSREELEAEAAAQQAAAAGA